MSAAWIYSDFISRSVVSTPMPRETPFPQTRDELADEVKAMNVHIFLAIPCYGCRLSARFVMSLLKLDGYLMKKGIRMTIDMMGHESLITRGRCILAERMLRSQATHLLFLDADIGFEIETILRMIAFDTDISCGIYAKKGLDFASIADAGDTSVEGLKQAGLMWNLNFTPGTKTHPIKHGFCKVYDAATGCMLITRRTLETLKDKYAHLTARNDISSSKGAIPEYVTLFETEICSDTKRFLSEDYSFCRKAQREGFDVWVDITAPLSHTGTYIHSGDISMRTKMMYLHA